MSFQGFVVVIGVFSSLITTIVKMQKDIEFLKEFYQTSKPLLDMIHRLEERINYLIKRLEDDKR